MVVALAGCRNQAISETPAERIAFLTLDNQTGDASLDWLKRIVPTMAAAQLTGVGRIAALRAEVVRDAYSAKATRFIHGYYTGQNGQLQFTFNDEDGVSHKMTHTVTVSGDPLSASDYLAKQVDSGAHPFSSTNAQAVEAWGRGDFEKAAGIDPDFGAAWAGWIQAEAAGGRNDSAIAIAGRALARPDLRSSLDKAQIALLSATLRNEPTDRRKALTELVKLAPNDIQLVRTLADQEFAARRFTEAAQLYRDALRIDPADVYPRNLLGYALFYLGDLAAARKELDEYGRTPSEEANALDSQGEVLFMAGQFAEAEGYFRRAHAKEPARLGGLDLSKAAYAHWLAGDLPGADKIFDEFLKYRSEHGDQAVVWRKAVWEYATGRPDVAKSRLMSATGQIAPVATQQLRAWSQPEGLPSDLAELEKAYETGNPSTDGLVRTLYARSLLRAGRTEEAANLLKLWPLPDTGDPLLQGFLFPMFRELKQGVGEAGGGGGQKENSRKPGQ